MTLVLSQFWDGEKIQISLGNHGPEPVPAETLCLSTMCWLLPGAAVEGGTLRRQCGTHHEISPDAAEIAPGEVIHLALGDLRHQPRNISHGIMAAWIENAAGIARISCEPLRSDEPYEPVKPAREGQLTDPVALLPWPAHLTVTQWRERAVFTPGEGMDPGCFEAVRALHQRLFPAARAVLSHSGGIPVHAEPGLARGYELRFEAGSVTLAHDGAEGLRHGLISLAHMAQGAEAGGQFLVPSIGRITDAPRFDWRGAHIDVARNFVPFRTLLRLTDLMAWHKLNRLHLHLTDDEGWRIALPSLPELAPAASRRGPGAALPPQFADGPDGQEGHYSAKDIHALLAHCAALGIEVMPEIDMPGHSLALLAAMPELRDPDEPECSYRSVGGHPNNALNPGLPATFEVIGKILDDICALFPSEIIHIGGDEVDAATWQASPAAQKLAEAEEIGGDVASLQSWFNARLYEMLRARGRRLGGWDECADGPGVEAEGTLLFAWRTQAHVAELAEKGYPVIATPGSAYYMDMRQGEGWGAYGAIWAGPVPLRKTYEYEASEGLSEAQAAQIKGLQLGIWTEFLNNPRIANYMMFPRFCAQVKLMPQL